jgi:hypothetical protein
MNKTVVRASVRSGLSAAVVAASLIAAGGLSAPSASAATQKLVAPDVYPVGDDPWTYVGTYSVNMAEAEVIALEEQGLEAQAVQWAYGEDAVYDRQRPIFPG